MKKPTVQTICAQMEKFAPPSLAPFDYVGLLQGDSQTPVQKIGITLDYTKIAIQKAHEMRCDFLITHHGPTTMDFPLCGNVLQKVTLAASLGIPVYRCHLNLDFCEGGIIDTLCQILGLKAKKQFTTYRQHHLYGGVNLSTQSLTLEDLISRVERLGGHYVRIAGVKKPHYHRIAITSGQGFISEFFDQLNPDLYIAGEFEQEATKYAEDLGITLIELGHHTSEMMPLRHIAPRLSTCLGVPIIPIETEDTITVHKNQQETL